VLLYPFIPSSALRPAPVCLWLALLGISAGLDSQAGDALYVRGSVKAYDFNQTGESNLVLSAQFHVLTGLEDARGCWRVATVFGSNHTITFGCDGTNIYDYLLDDTSKEVAALQIAGGTVVPGAYPLNGTWYTVLPWLAFASGEWLERNLNGESVQIPAPWKIPVSDPLAFAYRCEVVRFNGNKSVGVTTLPSEIRFYLDRKRLEEIRNGRIESLTTPNSEELARIQSVVPPSMSEPEAEFLAKGQRTVGGMAVPAEFSLRRYLVLADRSGLERRILWGAYFGEVEEVKITNAVSFLPEFKRQNLWLTDYRFRDPNGSFDAISYRVTDQQWPSTNDAVAIAAYAKWKNDPPTRPKRVSGQVRIIILALFGLSGLVLLWWVWLQQKKHRKV
jgi:hypothetical protein